MLEIPTREKIVLSVESIGGDSSMSLESGWSLLSENETKRARAFRFDIHRDRYVRGRALLRKKLASLLEVDPELTRFLEGEFGKPYLPDHPSLAFNISHSEDLAAFAFSQVHSAVGVDIELLDRKVDVAGLSARFFTSKEQRALAGLDREERTRLFFQIWTAKEARMKLTGEGLNLDPVAIEVEFESLAPVDYEAPSAPSASLESWVLPEWNATLSLATTSESMVGQGTGMHPPPPAPCAE